MTIKIQEPLRIIFIFQGYYYYKGICRINSKMLEA